MSEQEDLKNMEIETLSDDELESASGGAAGAGDNTGTGVCNNGTGTCSLNPADNSVG